MIGKIVKLSKSGWGFITSREMPFVRFFFHWTALEPDTIPFPELKLQMEVEFTPVKHDRKGYRAIKIRVIKDDDTREISQRGGLEKENTSH